MVKICFLRQRYRKYIKNYEGENCMTPIQLNEYTCLLFTETLDGMIKSMLEQEIKINELREDTQSNLTIFKEKYVNEHEIEMFLKQLFVIETAPDKEFSTTGMRYIPEGEGRLEFPEIFNKINYKMVENEDYEKQGQGFIITKIGGKRISEKVSIILAQKKQEILKSLFLEGIPRVDIENGRINSKVVLSLINDEHYVNKNKLLVETLKLNNNNLKNDFISEIEINFRSIVK
ncbi:conserved hypothetical protein [Paraburkholderia tropica]